MSGNPFTRTFGNAGKAYIDMHYSDEIIENLQSEQPSEYVYKITGVRGSGKTVVLSSVIEHFKKKDWIVCSLSAAGDPIKTLIAKLSETSSVSNKESTTAINTGVDISSDLLLKAGGNISVTKTLSKNNNYYNDEAELDKMINKVVSDGKKILLYIDDIAKTSEIVKFLSVYSKYVIEKKPVYLICTGLFQNIEDFSNEANISFFLRSERIQVKALDMIHMATQYKKLLGVDEKMAAEMSKMTKGYAYAYQVLGSLYYKNGINTPLENILIDFDDIIFSDVYEKIWTTLTEGEKNFIKAIITTDSDKRIDIMKNMKNGSSYNVLRSQLIKKHLLSANEYGKIEITLPRFENFVTLYH